MAWCQDDDTLPTNLPSAGEDNNNENFDPTKSNEPIQQLSENYADIAREYDFIKWICDANTIHYCIRKEMCKLISYQTMDYILLGWHCWKMKMSSLAIYYSRGSGK